MALPLFGAPELRTIAALEQKTRLLQGQLERQSVVLVEERRARMKAEQEAAARDEILAVVCHDLRSPLSAVLMTVDLLLRTNVEGVQSPSMQKHLERVERSSERMKRLVDDLVDVKSIQGGSLRVDPRPMAPACVVDSSLEAFQSLARERNIRLENGVVADLPQVSCDLDRAVQVLSNLLSNALGATSSGGAVTVGAERLGGEVLFWVVDTGAGMAPDELPHVFERSWRGRKPGYEGTGLGLFIARGIIHTHGGRIWAQSTPGVGSRFCFTLPSA